MKRMFETSTLGALLLGAGIALAPVGSFAQTADQLKQMSVEKLIQHEQFLRTEIKKGGDKKRKKRQLRQVQQELKTRKNQTAQPQAVQPQQQQQAQPQQVQSAPQQQAQPQKQDQSATVNREAQRYLLDNTDVRKLNDNQLQARIRNGDSLLQQDGFRGKLKRQVQNQVQAARAESTRRTAIVKTPPVQVVPQQQVQPQLKVEPVQPPVKPAQPPVNDNANANAEARDLLADTRSAASLRDPQLRRRLDHARRIMGNGDLDRRLFQQVRRMSRTDRDELRNRVARQDQNQAERVENRQDVSQLLGDRRDVRDLSDHQLQARIKSARDLLSSGTLRPGQKQRLQDLLLEARREKRRRLIAGRTDRRERLRRNGNNNQIIIQIPPVRIGPDRADIAAAEADDELLEQQLVAPPRRRVERTYSRQDFRAGRTSSRDTMPAIEVDTIRFGFNESFVREEEIPQLETIGEIIERIVAANPNEVFLIEGHTDAVGSAAYNQGLSSRRADAVRDAMLQFFNIEDGNIETVGYGEEFLKIETEEEEPENRRVTIRRITPLLTGQ